MLTMNPRQCGLSLIDVLVAIVLFSIGVLGLVALQASSTQNSVSAESRNSAALLADEMAAYFVGNNGGLPSSTTQTAWNNRISAALPCGTGTIAGTSGADMTVTITWIPPAQQTSNCTGSSDKYVTHVWWP